MSVILQSFHSGSGCRLRLFDRNIPLDASEGILPTGPRGTRRITCHCQDNLFPFDTKATVGATGGEMCHLCISENWLHDILSHVSVL